MSLHYLIDGYNVLYALADMPPGTWEDKRNALLRLLRDQKPQGNNAVTIVFDSRQGMGEKLQQDGMTVLFTAGETADDRIGELVRQSRNPRSFIVVSNDRGVQMLVRGTGAKFLTATEFLLRLKTADKRPPADHRAQRDAITEEFKKKWL